MFPVLVWACELHAACLSVCIFRTIIWVGLWTERLVIGGLLIGSGVLLAAHVINGLI